MSDSAIEERPQGEVDAVIGQLAKTDRSLATCLLVSKRWHAQCRHQSFRRARRADLDDLRSSGWYHVPHHDDKNGEPLILSSTTLLRNLHSKLFDRVTSLTLNDFSVVTLDSPAIKRTFSGLTSSVANLRLLQPVARPHSLLFLLSAFENLHETTVHAPRWEFNETFYEPIVDGNQFHGDLFLSKLEDKSVPFLSLLGSQSNYESITLFECNFNGFRPVQEFISASGKTIRRLYITVPHSGEHIRPLFPSHA